MEDLENQQPNAVEAVIEEIETVETNEEEATQENKKEVEKLKKGNGICLHFMDLDRF